MPSAAAVHVVVPVYRGLEETRRCVESLLVSQGSVPFSLSVIDDASPEPELRAYLRELAASGVVEVLENPCNLGFVATANRGLALQPERDVVLVNSDTCLPPGWLDRMCAHLAGDPRCATVTPLSNAASVCSFPHAFDEGPLPAGVSVGQLDAACRAVNAGVSVEIPAGVGFCMLIRRSCLDALGGFDTASFPRGYGEEVDFCLRAAAKGWRHRLALDVFVEHVGGASFGNEQAALKTAAQRVLARRAPHFARIVHVWRHRDPASGARQAAVAALLGKVRAPRRIACLSHALGGGVERHIRDLALVPELDVVWVRPASDAWGLRVGLASWPDSYALLVPFGRDSRSLLADLLRALGVSVIHVHHWLGWPDWVWSLAGDMGLPLDVTLHDYGAICPRNTLSRAHDGYCGEPGADGCARCLRGFPPQTRDIEAWRERFAGRLAAARRVFVPSGDAACRLRRYFPGLPLTLAAHEQLEALPRPLPPVRQRSARERLRVAVLGRLVPAKGLDILERCALAASASGLPLDFVVIGSCERALARKAKVRILGRYAESDLDGILEREAPDVVWFPAVWPETYSYTLSVALRGGWPVMTTDIGAFRERLQGRERSWVLPWNSLPEAWNAAFLSLLVGADPATSVPLGKQVAWLSDPDTSPIPGAEVGTCSDVDWLLWRARFVEWEVLRASRDAKRGRRMKQALLLGLYRLRAHPALAAVARRVPGEWASGVKRLLLR